MSFKFEPSWQAVLQQELQDPKIANLIEFLNSEYESGIPIYPPANKIFSALWKCPWNKTRVVIIGQDPYHGPGQAHGLCFSVLPGVPFPPSLQNIFKELQNDLGLPIPPDGCLDRWANQGVLLLNTVLTVRQGQAFSHQNKGWEYFTDIVVAKLGARVDPPIFILWGGAAQKKCAWMVQQKILPPENFIISVHPSPLSCYRGFFGSKPFSKVNALLEKRGEPPINW